jgi:DNA transposition AAA+ family ATPase
MPKENQQQQADTADLAITPSAQVIKSNLRAYPEAIAEKVWWLWNYAKENNLNNPDVGALLDTSRETVRRMFNAKYDPLLNNSATELVARIDKLRADIARREGKLFVMTPLATQIFQVCDFIRTHGSIAFVYGESQTGKTAALSEYQIRNNHGQTKMARCPATGGIGALLSEFCEVMHISQTYSVDRKRRAIFQAVDKDNLLILDEFHELFLGRSTNTTIACVEFIREIKDRTGCGLVICGTNAIPQQLDKGDLRAVLKQLARRGIVRKQCPDTIGPDDIAAIAEHYNLQPPVGKVAALVEKTAALQGIGALIKHLNAGSTRAAKQKRPLKWADFTDSVALMQQLATLN